MKAFWVAFAAIITVALISLAYAQMIPCACVVPIARSSDDSNCGVRITQKTSRRLNCNGHPFLKNAASLDNPVRGKLETQPSWCNRRTCWEQVLPRLSRAFRKSLVMGLHRLFGRTCA